MSDKKHIHNQVKKSKSSNEFYEFKYTKTKIYKKKKQK